MTKVLYLPLNYGDVTQNGVCDAFKDAGCNLKVFDYFYIYEAHRRTKSTVRKKLLEVAMEFKPDLIHMQIQHTNVIDANTINKIKRALPKCKISNWTGDVRNYVPSSFIKISKSADYNFISSTGQQDMFKKQVGKPVHYWQIGYDPKLYYPDKHPTGKFKYDVMFIANNNTKEGYPGRGAREKTCKLLRQAFGDRFCLHGNGWPKSIKSNGSVDQKKVGQAYHKSLCTVSVSHYNDLNHYFSDRLLMCLASGRPTISLKFPKWESYFTNMCDLVIANSIEDIVSQVKFLKKNRDLAEYIGMSGAHKAFSEHTYLSRVYELLDTVGLR